MVHSKYAHTFSIFEHFKKTSARILCVMTGWEKRTKEFENLTKIKSARFAQDSFSRYKTAIEQQEMCKEAGINARNMKERKRERNAHQMRRGQVPFLAKRFV